MVMFSKKIKSNCRFCFTDLWHEHAFVKCENADCVELGISICLQCFAAGTVDRVHKHTDPYKVLCNAVNISDYLWPANEEIMLLDTFMDTMSWEKVGRKLDRSPKECEHHYFENFVSSPKLKGLDHANKNKFNTFKGMVENRTNILDNTLNLEGTYYKTEINVRTYFLLYKINISN